MGVQVKNIILLLVILFVAYGCSSGGKAGAKVSVIPPENIELTAQLSPEGDAEVLIVWEEVPGATAYNIYYTVESPGVIIDKFEDKEDATEVIEQVGGSPFIHKNLIIESEHYYVITALFGETESIPSVEKSVVPTLLLPVPPVAPGAVKIDNNETFLILSWDEVFEAESYDLYWTTFNGVTDKNGTLIENVTAPFKFEETLVMNQSYYFILIAKNAEGPSPPSPQSFVKVNIVTAPRNVEVFNRRNSILITWDQANIRGEMYNIYWATSKNVDISIANKIEDAITPYVHDMDFAGQPTGTVYYYVVTRLSDDGESVPSREVSTSPRIIVPPETISLTGLGSSINVDWLPATAAETYNLYWSTTAGASSFLSEGSIESVDSPYTVTGLQDGVAYYFFLTSVNQFGESVESIEVTSFSDKIAVPEILGMVKDHAGINIFWDDSVGSEPGSTEVTEIKSYNLYWSLQDGISKLNSNKIENVSPGFYFHTGLRYNQNYNLAITAVNAKGESEKSEIKTIIKSEVSTLYELTQIDAVARIMSGDGALLQPKSLHLIDDVLYFISRFNPSSTYDLNRTDSTTEGTFPLTFGSLHSEEPYQKLVKFGEYIYFMANDNEHGFELWRTDGLSKESTSLFVDINIGKSSSNPFGFIGVGDVMYFSARTRASGSELWRTDGTESGTMQVKDINPGIASSNPFGFTDNNGVLFFFADNGSAGVELWTSDGTEPGTAMVNDLNGASHGSIYTESSLGVIAGDLFYFLARIDQYGVELWRSDGFESGTFMVKDLWPDVNSSRISDLTGFNGEVYFNGNNRFGSELFKSNGTAAGTTLFADIFKGKGGSFMSGLHKYKDKLFFFADDGSKVGSQKLDHGKDLWVTDGTGAGTVRFLDANPGGAGVSDYLISHTDDILFISSLGSAGNMVLWSSDGTPANTHMINVTFPSLYQENLFKFYQTPNEIYFAGINLLANTWDIYVIKP